MPRPAFLLAATLYGCSATLSAQTPPSAPFLWPDAAAVPAGEHLIVTLRENSTISPSARIDCHVDTLTPDELRCKNSFHRAPISFPRSQIGTLTIAPANHHGGAFITAGIAIGGGGAAAGPVPALAGTGLGLLAVGAALLFADHHHAKQPSILYVAPTVTLGTPGPATPPAPAPLPPAAPSAPADRPEPPAASASPAGNAFSGPA